jgi:hypothetical protein
MMRWLCSFRPLVLIVPLAVIPAACSAEKPTAEVQGRVTYKGVPLPEGIVLFLAEDRRQDIGSINLDGTYVAKRAPVGRNKISVQSLPPLPPPGPATRAVNEPEKKGMPTGDKSPVKSVAIPARYANTNTSGLSFTVEEGINRYDIELTP